MAIVVYIPNGADGKLLEFAGTLSEIHWRCNGEASFQTVSAAAKIVYDLDAQIATNFEMMAMCARVNAAEDVQSFASDVFDATVVLRQKAHAMLAEHLTLATNGRMRLASYDEHVAVRS